MTKGATAGLALAAVLFGGAAAGGRLASSADTTPTQAAEKQDDKPEMTVFLIGDAGAPAEHEPVLAALDDALSEDPRHSIVVFLGDNIYPDGMPDSTSTFRKEAERRLDAQLAVPKATGARGIFIAGNHDWGGISGRDGWNAVRRQGAYIAAKGLGSSMRPEPGCPGPAVEDVGSSLRLVLLDTQWWLRRTAPPKSARELVPCAFVSQKTVLDSLKAVIRSAGTRRVIMLSHHPLASQGTHGGYFSSKNQMFPLANLKSWLRIPLPMVGSVYVAARRLGMSEQDLSSSQYARLIQSLMSTFTKEEPLIFAGGHEHGLQVMEFQGAPRFVLVTGSGIYGHVSAVSKTGPARFAKAESGFMRIQSFADGRIRLTVLTVDRAGKATEAFDTWPVKQGIRPEEKKNAD
jgi:hypothetical protein